MPNWCYNTVTLYNEDSEKVDALEAVLTKLTDSTQETTEADGLFMHLRPRPQEEDEDWYGWNVNNWGVKWDVHPHDWTREDANTIYISFDSAWGAPTTLYEYMYSEEGGDWVIDAMYEEPGMAFVGRFFDGEEEFYEYDFENEDWREDIPEELVEFANLDDCYEDWKEWRNEEEVD